MREAGIVTSEEANRAARDWDTATDKIGRAFRGLLNEVQGIAAQIALAIINAAADAQRGLEKMRREAGQGTGAEGFGIGVEGITIGGGAESRPGRGITGETAPRPSAGSSVVPPMGQQAIEAWSKAWGDFAQNIIDGTEAAAIETARLLTAAADESAKESFEDWKREFLAPLTEEVQRLGQLAKIMGGDWATGFGLASDALIPLMRDLGDVGNQVGDVFGPDTVRRIAETRQQFSLFGGTVSDADDATLKLGTGSVPRLREEYKLLTPEAQRLDDLMVKLGVDAGGVDQLPAPASFKRRVRETAALIRRTYSRTGRGPWPAPVRDRLGRKLGRRARLVLEEAEAIWPAP